MFAECLGRADPGYLRQIPAAHVFAEAVEQPERIAVLRQDVGSRLGKVGERIAGLRILHPCKNGACRTDILIKHVLRHSHTVDLKPPLQISVRIFDTANARGGMPYREQASTQIRLIARSVTTHCLIEAPPNWRRRLKLKPAAGASKNARGAQTGRRQTITAESLTRYRSASVRPRLKIGRYQVTGKATCCAEASSSQIATLVERHTRYVMLVKVASKDTETVTNALIKNARKLPQELYKSLTWDRGTEMAGHKRFTLVRFIEGLFL